MKKEDLFPPTYPDNCMQVEVTKRINGIEYYADVIVSTDFTDAPEEREYVYVVDVRIVEPETQDKEIREELQEAAIHDASDMLGVTY